MEKFGIWAGAILASHLALAGCAHHPQEQGETVGQASEAQPPTGLPPETMPETGGTGVDGAEGSYGSASVYGPGGSDTTGSQEIPPEREPAPRPPEPTYPGTGGAGMDAGM